MASTLTSAGFGSSGPLNQTQTLVVARSAVAEQRNIALKATTLFGVVADNQKDIVANGNTKVWLKFYDDVSNTWAPGTTKSVMGFPVEAYNSVDDNQLIGTYQIMHSRSGVVFEKGLSVAASQEAGETMTTDPGGNTTPTAVLAVELVHS